MIFAGYGRVSTAKEAQLESLENQIEFFTQYAAANHHRLYRVYADEGISGKQIKNRIEFQKMLEDAKKHLFDMVVVKDISRFARNTVDLLTAIRELRSAGIEVQFLSNHQTVLGNSEFILTIFAALAQEESASLSKRVKFGKMVNAKRGRVPSFIYGYRQIDTFHLEIVEEEACVIRDMYQMLVHWGWGVRKIGMELNNRGIHAPSSPLWRPTTIRRMLRNPIYGGVLETHKSETVDFITGQRKWTDENERFRLERPELAIVPQDFWLRAQQVMDERSQCHKQEAAGSKSVSSRYSAVHLFSSLIRCEECGFSFARRHWCSKKSGTVYYWACSGRNNFSSQFCKNATTIKETELLWTLQAYLLHLIADRPGFLHQTLVAVEQQLEGKEPAKGGLPSREKEFKILERREARLKEMYTNDLIPMEELQTKLVAVRSKMEELRCAQWSSPPAEARQTLNRRILEEFSEMERLIDLSKWTNAQLRRIVEQIAVDSSGNVTVEFKRLPEPGGGR